MTEQIKKILTAERENLKKQLELFKSEDPLADPNQSSSRTTDDAITVSEGHDRIVATRLGLKQRLHEVERSLVQIDLGTWGICTNCGKEIAKDRLQALPTAQLCGQCEKEV